MDRASRSFSLRRGNTNGVWLAESPVSCEEPKSPSRRLVSLRLKRFRESERKKKQEARSNDLANSNHAGVPHL